MAKENQTGSNDTGGAGQKDAGNNDIAAGGQQDATQGAAGSQDSLEGLKSAAAAERHKRQEAESAAEAAKAENQALKDQMALMSQIGQQGGQQQPVQNVTLYKAVAKQLGIEPEYATPEEQGAIFEGMLQVTNAQTSEQAFVASKPDYPQVVGVQGPGGQFQYAPPLARVLKANPALANALMNSPNKAVLAYEIASKDPQYLAEKNKQSSNKDTDADAKAAAEAKKKIEEANKQLSISGAKTGSGNMDHVQKVLNMSDEEFRAHNEKIMAQAK